MALFSSLATRTVSGSIFTLSKENFVAGSRFAVPRTSAAVCSEENSFRSATAASGALHAFVMANAAFVPPTTSVIFPFPPTTVGKRK